MKKLWAMGVIITLSFTITACSSSDSKKDDINIKNDINILDKPSDDYYEENYDDSFDADISYDTVPEDDETEYENQQTSENREDTIYAGEIESLTLYMLEGYECSCTYTGEFFEDDECNLIPHGHGDITGTYLYSKGTKTCNFTYSGDFEYGKANGSGQSIETFEDNHTRQYDGQFESGNFHGEGKITAFYPVENPYNMVIEGIFADGHINGQGKKYWSYDNGDYFEYNGELKDAQLHGEGTFTKKYANGNIYHYTGTYADGKRTEGTQTISYSDGSSFQYEGEFKDDKYDGLGTSIKIYVNGDVEQYDGDFKEGAYNGEGIKVISFAEYSEPGDCTQLTSEGTFVNGNLSGKKCTQYISYYDGKTGVAEGIYEDGKFISGTEYLYDDEGNLINSRIVK